MGITIRKASVSDLERIMEIFCSARKFMVSSGNPSQWINGYPQQELIAKEIEQEHCYVCVTSNQTISGTFCLLPSPDPTYNKIYDGKWLNDEPYHVIHRLASDGSVKGIGKLCIDWCFSKCGNLRMDTHEDNHIMQSLAKRCGFVKCGIVHVANGTSRIAYQRIAP
ncbi:MAG: GNAT family N-acetyltransferase [Bacteroidaceae bacterium]|nr:GNAT family N-acetyltransferase [Bacteroidaceae bacterium]